MSLSLLNILINLMYTYKQCPNRVKIGRDPTRAALGVENTVFNAGADFPLRIQSRAPLTASCSSARSPTPPACFLTYSSEGGDPTPLCRGTLTPFRVGAGPQGPTRLPNAGCPWINPIAIVAAPLHTPWGRNYWAKL